MTMAVARKVQVDREVSVPACSLPERTGVLRSRRPPSSGMQGRA